MKSFSPVYLLLLCLLFFPQAVSAGREHSGKLQILVTSDQHGWLSTSQVQPTRLRKGLLHLKDFIYKARQLNPDLILLDGGDLILGSPLVHYSNHHAENPVKNNLFFNLVKELNYDAIAVGNHDIEMNPAFEKLYVPSSNFSWLAANVTRKGKLVFTPYRILKRGKIRIAIIGFTTPGSLMWLDEKQLSGIDIEPLVESARFWVKEVQKKENPDVVIGLFHAGLYLIRDDEISKVNRIPQANNVRQVAEEVPGFDLIVTGHDHRLTPYKTGRKIPQVSGTPIIEGGHWGEALLDIELNYQHSDKKTSVKSLRATVHRADQQSRYDEEYKANLSPEYQQFLFEPLPWIINKTNKTKASLCFNSLNAVAQQKAHIFGSLLPEISVKTLRSNIGKPIRRIDLFRWFRYDNRSVVVKLNQRDIQLLTNPRPLFASRRIPYNRKLFPWFNEELPEPSGYWWLGKEELVRDKLVVISDYHMNGGGGIIPGIFLNKKDIVQRSSKLLREDLFALLKNPPVKSFKNCDFLQFQEN